MNTTVKKFGEHIRGILTFNHKWLLDPIDGGTRVTQHEEYRGIDVLFWGYSCGEPAYSQVTHWVWVKGEYRTKITIKGISLGYIVVASKH